MRVLDLTGKTFGNLLVVGKDLNNTTNRSKWLCKCICGNTLSVRSNSLRTGNTKSCGCVGKEKLIERSKTHGLSNSKLYQTWCSMKSRCDNENTDFYMNYGGRGISYQPSWSTFENFLEDISDYLDVDPIFLKMMGVESNPKNLRIIYSAEYSMYPTVAPNSPLFVDISDKDPNSLKSGNVYVFMHNYELRMKRIFVSYGSNTVRLSSDNPDKNRYPDEFITNEQLNEINFVGRLELALVKP